jgi:hypothetical protein
VHLLYEVRRLGYFFRFGNGVPVARTAATPALFAEWCGWAQDAMLEAGLIHVRTIVSFLTSPRPKANGGHCADVVAHDYFEAGGWNPPPLGQRLDEIHQRVAHITTRRASVGAEGDFEWTGYVTSQVPLTLAAFRSFLTQLATLQQDWFADCDQELTRLGY